MRADLKRGCGNDRLIACEYTTLGVKVNYHKALTPMTGRVRAEATLLSFGRRAAVAEAKLTDAEGRLYASATLTLLVFDKPR